MNPLISADELAEILDDPSTRVADVRWYLEDPDGGHEAYHRGHIPGAVFVHLDHHLSSPEGPGRHPLPSRDEFAATMGRLGFGDDDLIVTYDDRGGMIAARLWWLLRSIGHEAVQVLESGLPAWVEAGLPLDAGPGEHPPRTMTVGADLTRTADRDAVAARSPEVVLLDARDSERYSGEEEPVDPVAGHIPGAVSLPVSSNLDAAGRFLSVPELAERYRTAGAEGDEVIVYCGSGVTATHHALARAVAGLPEPILYPGSWSDWSASGMPVATGSEP